MIRRVLIMGILSAVMLILMWNFYTAALVYDPLGEVERLEEATGAKVANAAVFAGPAWGREIQEKDLFVETRGRYVPPPPPPPSVSAIEAPRPIRPSLALRGIIVNQMGEHVALIEKNGAKPVPLRAGDTLDDVHVVDIDDRTATLKWNEEDIVLSLVKIRTLKPH